ncbi:MAG: GNAT family N-acetyltransferase [Ignavibacteriales bacterium]
MQFDLECCKVRSWKWDDEESLIHNADNRNIWINLRDRFPHPYTQQDARNWLKIVVGATPETQFAIEVDGRAVGGIGFLLNDDVHRIQVEMGYWLGEEFWGRGIMTEALKAVTKYAFNNFEIKRIYAGLFEWNKASARVLEKAGYELECRQRKSVIKNGVICDQLVYVRII